ALVHPKRARNVGLVRQSALRQGQLANRRLVIAPRIIVIKGEREMTFALFRPETKRRFGRSFRACDASRALIVTEPIKLGVDARDEIVRLGKFGIESERPIEQRQRQLAVLLRIADSAPTEQLARL